VEVSIKGNEHSKSVQQEFMATKNVPEATPKAELIQGAL
jgi:hypothetical protein